ncbi:class I SAM-dependent methyltransferase [Streptomyces sp. NPDC018045]|uniref:class I SAM-dependent methyltransferase n=1 Tax=Streptomyces sp. NPDC018045 TaxID=3365037 RepID=UPI0037B2034A
MADATTHRGGDTPAHSFLTAGPRAAGPALARLTAAVWADGLATAEAAPAAAVLVRALERLPEHLLGRALVLLGLLAEADGPGAPDAYREVRKGLGACLRLLERSRGDDPLVHALLYVVSHFPEDRERILDRVDALGLAADVSSRIRRCLRPLAGADAVIGRVWPSPAEWDLTDAEREQDRQWVAGLGPARLAAAYDGDTRMLLGYAGALAHWAVRHGTPRQVHDARAPRPSPYPSPAGPAAWSRHAAVLRCPCCGGRPSPAADGHATCAACSTRYPAGHGILDLTAPVEADADPADVLRNAATLASVGHYYETVLRPGFLRLMGGNWSGAVTPADEDAYIAAHTRPADGPVLDLAAGAGRWTGMLAEAVGVRRLIALDLNPSMLRRLRGAVPEAAAVRADALSLPFDDGSLGAVNCWNALQAMPDPAAVVAEAARCLRPLGTLTLMTFRAADDPVDRYFQRSFRGPGFPDGMPLGDLSDITAWVTDAGLDLLDASTPGNFVMITARRPG